MQAHLDSAERLKQQVRRPAGCKQTLMKGRPAACVCLAPGVHRGSANAAPGAGAAQLAASARAPLLVPPIPRRLFALQLAAEQAGVEVKQEQRSAEQVMEDVLEAAAGGGSEPSDLGTPHEREEPAGEALQE